MIVYHTHGKSTSNKVFVVDINGFHETVKFDGYTEMHDFGAIPSQFRVISKFPIGYWHRPKNYPSCDLVWYNCVVWFDPKDINLFFTEKNFIYEKYNDVIKEFFYCIFVHKNVKYCLVFFSFNDGLNLNDIVKKSNGLNHYNIFEDLEFFGNALNLLTEKTKVPKEFILFSEL